MPKFSNKPRVSIVLPCFNPSQEWGVELLQNILSINEGLPKYDVEYIVSNDGSTSLNRNQIMLCETIENFIFVDHALNRGKGSAIRHGLSRATGDIIIYTDLDFPFGTKVIVEMIDIFAENPECSYIYGNRSKDYFNNLPFKRKLFSKALRAVNRVFLGSYITDTQAGIKGFRRNILPFVQATKTNTFVFEIELARKLIKNKISICKVNVDAKPSILFTDFSFSVLAKEAVNLVLIIISPSI